MASRPASIEAAGPSDGLVVMLPPAEGGVWRWWPIAGGRLGTERTFRPGIEALPWGAPEAGATVIALVPAHAAPVRDKPMPAMPAAQALAAERLSAAAAPQGAGPSGERHVAVAFDGARMLSAAVARDDMARWLAATEQAGLEGAALVPAGLVLPRPATGVIAADLGGQPVARTPDAAFAGEPALVGVLASDANVEMLGDAALADALVALHANVPLDLRQGAFAPRRRSTLKAGEWRDVARLGAVAALLALVLVLVWIARWEFDIARRDGEALAAAQVRFPGATDIDGAERLVMAELIKRGQGQRAFSAPAAAVLKAMQPVPALRLRDLGYSADGTLRFTAAAPRAEDVNLVLLALQRDGWKVTVPPALAPDPTGATVAAITVSAP